MIKIGNCPDSWGVWFDENEKQPDWRVYLDEVARAGYKYTETGPFGYMTSDSEELQAELDKRGLKVVATTVMLDVEDDRQTDEAIFSAKKACERLKAVGGLYYIIMDGMYTDLLTDEWKRPRELGETEFDRLCTNYRRLAKAVRGYGITPVFHPHGGTHVETEAQIDRMISKIPREELRFCFDTGHHIYVQGNDVYTYTEKIAGQIELLHLKDLVPEIKEQCWRECIPYAAATKRNIFAEIGKGQIDWERYGKILEKIGFNGYAVIEHDCYPPVPGEALEVQSRTGRYLERLGIGTLK